ncbi:MAG: DNA polymerase II large subunit [archaeon]
MNPETYFTTLEKKVKKEFDLAAQAREKGLDPATKPEIYLAKDLAEKVEGLIEMEGLANTIREISKKFDNELEIAFHLAKDIVSKEADREKAADLALRASLAFLTQGAVSAPLEGIAKLKIKKNPDDTEYLSVYYSGPIRAAGGTAEALSVLMADYIRKQLGLDCYKATLDEIGRYIEEVQWYHRHVHLQYFPSEKEIQTIAMNVPICIDGEPTEEFEVANYRDLGRVETNRVRGGMCLVLAEGIAQKAPKLLKRLNPLQKEYGLDWSWLNELIHLKAQTAPTKQEHQAIPDLEFAAGIVDSSPLAAEQLIELAKEHSQWDWMDEETETAPETGGSTKYIQEIPAGRPVFSHPSRKGGFSLRYGRSRAGGHSAVSLHPATMSVLDNFIAIGTQIRLEFPGKAAITTPCDTIDGPIVLLEDGEVLQLTTLEQADEIKPKVKKILRLGDILISGGDFLENNHKLRPGAYAEEWWAKEVLADAKTAPKEFAKYLRPPYPTPNIETALKISKKYNTPLHPQHTFFWGDLNFEQLKNLISALKKAKSTQDHIEFENEKSLKNTLETLCIFHKLEHNKILITEHAQTLLKTINPTKTPAELDKLKNSSKNMLELISTLTGVKVMDRKPTPIGARMGRPEKAKPRKMSPAPHSLFPTGANQGRVRDLIKASEMETSPDIAKFTCLKCNTTEIFPRCSTCGTRTILSRACTNCKRSTSAERCPACGSLTTSSERRSVDIKKYLADAAKKINTPLPKSIKGVIGMTSRNKIPEALEKGILRATENIYAFKDGTIRFDSTNAPLTHFRPAEIGTSVENLKKLGYITDIKGKELTNNNQLLELKPQDIVLSSFGEDSAPNYLLRNASFVDNLLQKYYGLDPYYKLKTGSDLIGHLVIALAPHTSTGIIGRIIGFTKARVGFAHPAFHAAKRRDCDGDEDAVMLLLDAFLNFSRSFLPAKRGGRMDAPLVITTKLELNEVDDEVYDFDINSEYDLQFYKNAQAGADPNEIGLKTVSSVLGSTEPFANWMFTHDTSDINLGPIVNSYTEGEMIDKLERQLTLAEKINAVNEKDVAERIIDTHFLPDMKGNLRTFSRQKVRCTKCNAKYRRAPLKGVCLRCGGNLTLTVHKGTIEKYLGASKKMAKKYNISPYLNQQIEMVELSLESIFGKPTQSTLEAFSEKA